ncbi:hypothetical protein BJF79_04365 [Actinomadura sp. CNU-125]|uniref:hypothetical protein n=1 Tax=Actinomadura sp. CNU-125 TaxID=1904961 RepID=UPI000960D1BF|nr:hypothetical protein [Actinomadura sp. CNU-125]OLT12029.1 hypothetical protein BJF79_04365 [Actinomadura sp. CNU-125]
MNVLFVALGASRRTAITTESRRVVEAGGTAVVLIRKPDAWRADPFPDGVDGVELRALERGYRPAAVRILLYGIPRKLLRACTPGPLRGPGRRIDAAYMRRVARPVNRRLAGVYGRDPVEVRRRAVRRELLRARSIDLVVVGDAQSLATVAELADVIDGAGAGLSYTVANERG